jgi:hypothetical protein
VCKALPCGTAAGSRRLRWPNTLPAHHLGSPQLEFPARRGRPGVPGGYFGTVVGGIERPPYVWCEVWLGPKSVSPRATHTPAMGVTRVPARAGPFSAPGPSLSLAGAAVALTENPWPTPPPSDTIVVPTRTSRPIGVSRPSPAREIGGSNLPCRGPGAHRRRYIASVAFPGICSPNRARSLICSSASSD